MSEEVKEVPREPDRPTIKVGQLWRYCVYGGRITIDCVVVAVGERDVVLGVLSHKGSLFGVAWVEHDVTSGATIVRNKNIVSSYWCLVA